MKTGHFNLLTTVENSIIDPIARLSRARKEVQLFANVRYSTAICRKLIIKMKKIHAAIRSMSLTRKERAPYRVLLGLHSC
jgi:hypothetical protein